MKNLLYHMDMHEKILPFSNLLFDHFQINYFHFVRIYDDGTRISLTNCKKWMEFYYENKYYQHPTFLKSIQLAEDKYCPWITLQTDKVLQVLQEKFNICNGITIIEQFDKYREYYYFGTFANNFNIYNLYMNNKTIFKDFIIFFKSNGRDFIKKCELNRIPRLEEKILFNNENNYSDAAKEFFTHLSKNNRSLHIHENIRITKRELECILWCIKGKTAEEIAIILGITNRAVESYFANLKEKFNCYKLPELVYKLTKCCLSLENYLDYYSDR